MRSELFSFLVVSSHPVPQLGNHFFPAPLLEAWGTFPKFFSTKSRPQFWIYTLYVYIYVVCVCFYMHILIFLLVCWIMSSSFLHLCHSICAPDTVVSWGFVAGSICACLGPTNIQRFCPHTLGRYPRLPQTPTKKEIPSETVCKGSGVGEIFENSNSLKTAPKKFRKGSVHQKPSQDQYNKRVAPCTSSNKQYWLCGWILSKGKTIWWKLYMKTLATHTYINTVLHLL